MEYLLIFIIGFAAGYYVGERYDIRDFFIDIFPEGIGLFLVLSTWLSKFLSTMSFTMHPALLIKTEPKKNKTK